MTVEQLGKAMKTSVKIIIASMVSLVIGLRVGDSCGRKIGYERGVVDHADELVQSADSLRIAYQQELDELLSSDTVHVTRTTYTIIKEK